MPVYMIRAGAHGHVKIGWAADPDARLATLQTAHYDELQIIRLIDARPSAERWLHRQFARCKIAREWFQFDPRMLHIIPPISVEKDPCVIETHADVIQAFGGLRPFCQEIEVKTRLAVHWPHRGIPAKYWPAVERAAKSRAKPINITAEMLMRLPRQAQEAA